jgi:hypothetical protein
MNRAVLRFILLLLLLAAPMLRGDEPRFFIETIDVRNLRHASPDIVRAESRLDPQHAYSEHELREASDRVARLPFVLDAQFSLEKGSRREAYVLVITVDEATPFFFGLDMLAVPTRGNGDHQLNLVNEDRGGALGYRFFAGRRGAFHVAVGQQEFLAREARTVGIIQAGYTQYDLFGVHAFATLNIGVAPDASRSLLTQLLVGVPLTPTQTLTASLATSNLDYRSGNANRYDSRSFRVEWTHNTTNDLILPTRGTILSAGPVVARDDDRISTFDSATGQTVRVETRSHTLGLGLAAAHYWQLSERNSIGLRGQEDFRKTPGTRSGSVDDLASHSGEALLRYTHLLHVRTAENPTESALQFGVHYFDHLFHTGLPHNGSGEKLASVSWVRRSSWGILRFGVGYAW